jgi:PTH2 family peptidyl-tRNA hydrolase
MTRISKQIIVMRKSFIIDGKQITPRKGKYIAQGSHACLKPLLDMMETYIDKNAFVHMSLHTTQDTALWDWIKGSFTKVCVSVETEEELLDVYNKAKEKGLLTSLITDSGRTEFGGVPTNTCCSILGWSDEVDEITGKLQLF